MCRAYALPARISSPAVCRHRPRVPPHLARKLSIVLPEVWATKARQGQRAGVVQSRAGIRFNLLSGPYSRSGGSVHGTCDPVSLWWRRPSAASPRRPPSVGRWRWELRKRQPQKRQPLLCFKTTIMDVKCSEWPTLSVILAPGGARLGVGEPTAACSWRITPLRMRSSRESARVRSGRSSVA